MKYLFLLYCSFFICITGRSQVELSGTTIGFSLGISHAFGNQYDYSLDPGNNNLVLQKLSSVNFVISSVLTIKLSDLSIQNLTTTSPKTQIVLTGIPDASGMLIGGVPVLQKASWKDRFAINIALNLGEFSSGNIAFNKPIDGGIGLGYILSPAVQIGSFFDIIRIRQIRNYIVDTYQNKPIPKQNVFYTALDPSDNNLYFSKTFTGFSMKIIIALNPKKI